MPAADHAVCLAAAICGKPIQPDAYAVLEHATGLSSVQQQNAGRLVHSHQAWLSLMAGADCKGVAKHLCDALRNGAAWTCDVDRGTQIA